MAKEIQDKFADVDIFDTESRLARITEGLEPGARVEPVELTPAEERVAGLASLLQKGGERGVPLLGTFEDPRQAYQMSQKLLRLVDPRQQGGIGEFLPGFSYELARERKDPLGQGLSLLDLIPGGGLIKPGVKTAAKKITLDQNISKEQFGQLADKGKIIQARDQKESLDALLKGDSPAQNFRFDDEFDDLAVDYESGDFTKKLKDKGYHVIDNKMGTVIVGRTKTDAENLLKAKNPYELGKSYGYSDEDIAQFYVTRRGGNLDIGYEEFIADLSKQSEGIKSLPAAQQKIQQEVDELAKTPNKEFTSPTLRGLLESAPRNLKGQALIDWTRANANKGIKPKEVEVLDLENYIKANPDQNVKEVVQGVKDKQIKVSKEIYEDFGAPEIDFDVTKPAFDPLDSSIKNYQYILDDLPDDLINDKYKSAQFYSHFLDDEPKIFFDPSETTDAVLQARKIEFEDYLKNENLSYDDALENFAVAKYFDNPYELVTPKSVGEFRTDIPDKTFAFGNDETGYELFIDGQRVTNSENIAYSQTEARIQLMNKLEEGGDPLRQVGGEDLFTNTRYKDYMDETLPGGSNYREVVFRLDNVAEGQFPKHDVTHHFQEDDAISHALIRDRKLADGTDTLHIDELQSDLHTKGSRFGYLGDQNIEKTKKQINIKNEELVEKAKKIKQKFEEAIPKINRLPREQLTIKNLIDKRFEDFIKAPPGEKLGFAQYIDDIDRNILSPLNRNQFGHGILISDSDKLNDLVATVNSAVPNYPFKDDWYVMSIKQLLQDAVDRGKSALSVSGSLPIKARYTDDYSKFYESLYDQKIPSAMKKLANKYGGKFEKVKLNIEEVDQAADEIGNNFFLELENKFLESDAYRKTGLNMDDNLQETRKLYKEFEDKYFESNTIRITPEMRERILKEGLDTFGTGGAVSNLGKAIENVDIFS